jgi:hypothetical protein
VLVLPVAAFGRDQIPPVSLDQLDHLANLQWHKGCLSGVMILAAELQGDRSVFRRADDEGSAPDVPSGGAE